jgi:hypothetical protein
MRHVRGRPVTPIAADGTLCHRFSPHGFTRQIHDSPRWSAESPRSAGVIRDSGQASGLFRQHGRRAGVTRTHSHTPAWGGVTAMGHATTLITFGYGDLARPRRGG